MEETAPDSVVPAVAPAPEHENPPPPAPPPVVPPPAVPANVPPEPTDPAVAGRQRDQLWDMTWKLYYRSSYNTILADKLTDKWRAFDNVSKISLAFTSTGSAAAGWAVWASGSGKIAWAIIAGLGVIISIFHSSLGVAGQLKDWIDCKRNFSAIELDLEAFRDRMKFDKDFPVAQFMQQYDGYRARFSEAVQKIPGSSLMSAKLKSAAQSDLQTRLTNEA